jgi:hypothetical protein
MRIQTWAVALAAVSSMATLGACSSTSNGTGALKPSDHVAPSSTSPHPTIGAATGPTGSSGPGGTASAFCVKLIQGQQKLGELGGAASDPSSLPALFDTEIAYFKDLKNSAPPQLAAAIGDLVTVLQAGKDAMTNPSSASASAMSDLLTKIPADAKQIADYVAANCGGS